jgi:ABC-type polysaccharide/polyol phosphate transport system ATPase subunit
MPSLPPSHDAAARTAMLAAAPAAIRTEGATKSFKIPRRAAHTLKERALHPLAARDHDVLVAFEPLDLQIRAGEFFGIVGRNGSGKSTLLKCLAGIYGLDAGHADITGRLSPFIELGVGFNPNLTARDNVFINAIMLGLTRRQARERFEDIVAFAELEGFLDLRLKNYSSGMVVRLAFAVAIEVDADILLVDEVLAVGDAAFQQKCFEAFQRMKNEGRTIVLVTHDMHAVEHFCDRAMLIERGRVLHIGDPHQVARQYNEVNFGRLVHEPAAGAEGAGRGAAQIVTAWFEDDAGEPVARIEQGRPLSIVTEVRFGEDLDDPIFAVTLRNDALATIFATSTDWTHGPTGRFRAGEVVRVRVRLENHLAPSRYTVTPSVAQAGAGADALDLREDLAALRIHATRQTGGVVDAPHSFAFERVAP